MVKGLRGFIQGYNAQAVTNEQQVVLAAEVMVASPDFGHLEPMLCAAERELASRRRQRHTAGGARRRRLLAPRADGAHRRSRASQVLIPPDSSRRKGARPGWDGGLYAFMRRVLATEHGGELYGKRQPMIEPVFGDMKFNRGLGRLHRRGRAAARTEWRLITATHNLLKLHRHTLTPAAA